MFIYQVFIWTDSKYEFVLGFIVPDKDYILAKLHKSADIDYNSFLSNSTEVKNLIYSELKRLEDINSLSDYERLSIDKRFMLLSDPFT